MRDITSVEQGYKLQKIQCVNAEKKKGVLGISYECDGERVENANYFGRQDRSSSQCRHFLCATE